MTLKERIVNEFLADDRRNFTVFGTNVSELSTMYDNLVAKLKSGEKFSKFLNFEGAVTLDGKVRLDRQVTYHDQESHKNMITRVAFKYPVYTFFYNLYQDAMNAIKKRDLESLKNVLDANQNNYEIQKGLEIN